jgi:hypothetical protein
MNIKYICTYAKITFLVPNLTCSADFESITEDCRCRRLTVVQQQPVNWPDIKWPSPARVHAHFRFPFCCFALGPAHLASIMSSAKAHMERAINQIQDKSPIPVIDFTQHQLEDGNTISTQERVVKDVRFRQIQILVVFFFWFGDRILTYSWNGNNRSKRQL